MAERGERSYSKELFRLLEVYRSLLKDYSLDGINSLYEEPWLSNHVKKQIPKLKNLFKYYSKGDLVEFNKTAYRLFNTRARGENSQYYFPKTKVCVGSHWYRARKLVDKKKFVREDLFHVPFGLRGIIGSDRFSIVGYPCLYLGKTLKCVDAETPPTGIKAVSCFKNRQDIEVYDLTFFPHDGNQCICKHLLSYPFKIAASIPKMREEKDVQNKFFPEYIIPQLLLHWTIRNRRGTAPEGIIYSSTQAIADRINENSYSEYTNIVVPASIFKEKGLCSHLNSLFSMTEPEIVPFPDLRNSSLEKLQYSMQQKEFNQIDVDYEP